MPITLLTDFSTEHQCKKHGDKRFHNKYDFLKIIIVYKLKIITKYSTHYDALSFAGILFNFYSFKFYKNKNM